MNFSKKPTHLPAYLYLTNQKAALLAVFWLVNLYWFDGTTKVVSRLSMLAVLLAQPYFKSSLSELSFIETLGIYILLLSFLMYVGFNYRVYKKFVSHHTPLRRTCICYLLHFLILHSFIILKVLWIFLNSVSFEERCWNLTWKYTQTLPRKMWPQFWSQPRPLRYFLNNHN